MQLLGALQARTAAGGVPPGGGPAAVAGGPGGAGPAPGGGPDQGGGSDAGSVFNQMASDLRRADPNVTMNQMKQIKQVLAAMLVHNLEPNPAFSGQVARIIPLFDRAMKELERAASVSGAVRQPIQMGAAMPTPPQSAGATTGIGPGAMGSVGPQGA